MIDNEKEVQALRAMKEEQELAIFRRVLTCLAAVVCLEILVLLGNRYFFHYMTNEIQLALSLMQVLEVLQYAGVGVGVLLLLCAIFAHRKYPKAGMIRSVLGVSCILLSVCAILFLQVGQSSVSLLLASIPSLGALMLVYYLYQKEFFVLTLLSTVGIFGLWVFRQTQNTLPLSLYHAYLVVGIVVVAVIVGFSWHLSRNEGQCTWCKCEREVFADDANYGLIWLTSVAVVLCLVAALFLGMGFAYYAFLSLIVWVFVMAVYYTARLM